MRHSSIAATLVRLFAIGLVIYAFRNAGMAFFFIYQDQSDLDDLYMLFTGIAVPVLAAGLLWVAPNAVVGFRAKNDRGNESTTLDPVDLFSVGVALLGLYLVATALAHIFDWYLSLQQQEALLGDRPHASPASYFDLYSELFLLVVGTLFILGSSGFGKLFRFLRNYGIDAPDSSTKRGLGERGNSESDQQKDSNDEPG
jgi:hypothetical protein